MCYLMLAAALEAYFLLVPVRVASLETGEQRWRGGDEEAKVAVDGLKKSECTLREMPLPMLVVCDACSCASLQTRACVLVVAQQQAAV